MGKGGFGILILMVLLIALMAVLSQYDYAQPNDVRRTFSSKDAIRNGTKAIKEIMPLMFPDANIKIAKTTFARYDKEHHLVYNYDEQYTPPKDNSTDPIEPSSSLDTDSNNIDEIDTTDYENEIDTFSYLPTYSYLLVDDGINLNRSDVSRLFKFVSQGNTVLIASADIPLLLLDSLRINSTYNYFETIDSAKPTQTIQLLNRNIPYQTIYTLKEKIVQDYYTSFDSAKVSIIALLDNNKPVALEYKYGGGEFIFTTMHSLFLNQNIVKKTERKIVYTLLNYANADNIIWDEYYKKFNLRGESNIDFIKNSKGLYAAYISLLCGIVFYMIFESKRRQREIKIITKPENSTLNFVHVITSLYRKNSDTHKDILKQKLLHWYDLLKNKLRIDVLRLHTPHERLILSEKTGIDLDKINTICNQIKYLEVAHEISNKELSEFDRYMELFEKFN
jgi:hypothetical protein